LVHKILKKFHVSDVSWYQKGKTSVDLNEAIDDGVSGCSGVSCRTIGAYADNLHLSPDMQITTPTPHHSIFTGGCSS